MLALTIFFRILQNHTEGHDVNSQAIQTLQDRLREAESAVKREQDSYRQMQVNKNKHQPIENQ